MNFYSTLLLGLAMSTDAFAAALGKGAGMNKPRWRDALRIGLLFGVVEGITPIIGWLIGTAASRFVDQWDHWIAFALLLALGLHMIWEAFHGDDHDDDAAPKRNGALSLLLTSIATSIDALAIGVGLAFMNADIGITAAAIGLCTFTMVTIGIKSGHVLGTLIGKRAEFLGGLVLIAVGATILYEGLRH